MRLQYSLRWRIVDRRFRRRHEAEAQTEAVSVPAMDRAGLAAKVGSVNFFSFAPRAPRALLSPRRDQKGSNTIPMHILPRMSSLKPVLRRWCILTARRHVIYVFGLRTVVELFERRKYIDVVSEVGFPSLREDGGHEASHLTQEKLGWLVGRLLYQNSRSNFMTSPRRVMENRNFKVVSTSFTVVKEIYVPR